jgi:antitoxin component of MazEF toxin-antitoxin module
VETFTFTSVLWRWPAQDAWRVVTLPEDVSEAIRLTSGPPRGFGSVRVAVTVGDTSWRTSVFPDGDSHGYVLPMKRAVRQAENLEDGDSVTVTLQSLES